MAAVAVPPALNRASRESHNHPSYKEMIAAAIRSLKEKNGSTESSIAAYISSKYKNLPPTHNDQLSRHLKDLKKQGLIETVHSYKLATGENTSSAASKKRGRPKKSPSREALTTPSSGKSKRGRPHKSTSSGPTLILPQHMKAFIKADKRGSTSESGEKRIRAPPKRYINESSGKRKAGRPKKSFSLMVVSGEKKKRGRPSLSAKKRPGRPKKGTTMLLLGAAESSAAASPVAASGGKRKRGRPSLGSSARVSGKPRGRPPKIEKNGSSAVKEASSAMKEGSSAIKRRGRPVKIKRGRPGKTKSIASIGAGDVVGETVVETVVDLNTTAGDGEDLGTAEGNGEMGIDLNINSGRIGEEGST